MDLKKLIPAETAKIDIVDPVSGDVLKCSDGTEMFIVVYGADSKEYRKISADIARQAQGKRSKKITPELAEKMVTEQLSMAICDWNIEYDGGKPALDAEKAFEVLNNVRWLREQVAEGIGDRTLFLS